MDQKNSHFGNTLNCIENFQEIMLKPLYFPKVSLGG